MYKSSSVERAQKRQPHARAIAGHARGAVLERGEVGLHATRDAPAEVRERFMADAERGENTESATQRQDRAEYRRDHQA